VYGGKPGRSLGPDFTDAVIERDDGTTFRGDIEIHVREADWRAHGHHTDPRYNGVVLHVVGAISANSTNTPALKATGTTIPLLALNWKTGGEGTSRAAPHTVDHPQPLNPTNNPSNKEKVPLAPLVEAGLERFHSQAAGIALDIAAFGEDQAIWLGVLGALGYPRNKRAFRAVATRVGWELASACQNPLEIELLLTRAAGLEKERPAAPSGGAPRKLELRGTTPDWVRPWGRPANSPAVRIEAISALVKRWAAVGGISRACQQAVLAAANAKDLSTLLRPVELLKDDSVIVLGAARAGEIVVNVILPAVFAIATLDTQSDKTALQVKNRAIELYSSHPKLAENSVTREATIALGIDFQVPKITGAREQGG
jgi:hypothetical protein